jgi:hypothetical protein
VLGALVDFTALSLAVLVASEQVTASFHDFIASYKNKAEQHEPCWMHMLGPQMQRKSL